jgi:hypothetical protein
MATVVTDVRRVVAKLDADDVAELLRVPQFGGVDGHLVKGKSLHGSVDRPYASALYEMDVPAGKVFSACVEDGMGPWIYGPDGRPVGAPAVLSKNGGHYRVLASKDEAGSFTITPELTTVEPVSIPGSIPAGGDGDCGARMYSFDATAGQGLMFGADSGDDVTVTTPSGETFSGSAFMPKESGRHMLTVQGGSPVTVEPLPADVLTVGSHVTGSLTGNGPATYRVFVDAGQSAEIQVYSAGTVLPSVELYDQAGSLVGRDSAGYVAYASVSPDYYDDSARVYELRVSDYFDDSGDFLVTVVPR